MILAQLTDTHLMTPAAGGEAARRRMDDLQRCVDDINALDPRPDAVIHTGDMTQHGDAEEYAVAAEILSGLDAPFYPTPGNRDHGIELAKTFGAGQLPADASFIHYAIDAHPVRLVAVDSTSRQSNKGNFCDARLTALDATLAQMPNQPTALFLHHPPFDVPTIPEPFQYERREAADGLAAVVSRHGQVVRIFCGHVHRPWVTAFAGTVAGTVPSVCTELRKGPYPAAMMERPFYQVHRFDPSYGFASETHVPAVGGTGETLLS